MQPLEQAQRYVASGLSVVSIRADGSKAADRPWTPFQKKKPTDQQLQEMFNGGQRGIAVISGEVSGGLEVIDFENGAPIGEFFKRLQEELGREFATSLPLVQTPSGGLHVYYRCPGHIEGNLKLAWKRKGEIMIETRGEGGYVAAPGSPPACHPSGKPYTPLAGGITQTPIITTEQRKLMLDLARDLTEWKKPEPEFTPHPPTAEEEGDRPGDIYNREGPPWPDILQPHGWSLSHTVGCLSYWRRPGKKDGHSASINFHGNDQLHVFSSNAHPFEPERSYTKFRAYTLLNHGGDFSAAAQKLRAEGYGGITVKAERKGVSSREPAQFHSLPQKSRPVDLLNFGFHDSGNADRIIQLFGKDMRYCPAYRNWLLWDGRRWRKDDTKRAKKLAKQCMIRFLEEAVDRGDREVEKFAKSSLNDARIRAALELAEPELAITSDQLDQHPFLLNCKNGTLDLRTGDLRTHSRGDHLTKLVHFDYRPGTRCDRFVRFLDEIMGASLQSSPEEIERVHLMVQYLQKLLGHALTADVSEKIVVCFFGDGNNGKTTLLDTVRFVISEYSHQVLIENLMVSRHARQSNASLADLADLKGARFVTTSEGEKGQRLAESKIKYLSAGMGEIKACRKYENPIKFPATHKLYMDSNYKPIVRGTDAAIWNRLKTVPFPTTIPNDYVDLDPRLPRKLKAEAEGILAWLVEGCLLWQKEGLREPPEVCSANESWRAEMDPLRDFIEDRCRLDQTLTCTIGQLWAAYLKWCDQNKERPCKRRDFNERLELLGCRRDRSGRTRFWEGIGLLDEM